MRLEGRRAWVPEVSGRQRGQSEKGRGGGAEGEGTAPGLQSDAVDLRQTKQDKQGRGHQAKDQLLLDCSRSSSVLPLHQGCFFCQETFVNIWRHL